MPELKEPLRVETASRGDEVVLVLQGELDPHTAPVLRAHVDASVADSTRRLVLDVGGLAFIDSSGLRVIIAVHKEMASRGGHLVLRHPTPTTERLLDITGLDDHIEVE